jgi:hypothetical protein
MPTMWQLITDKLQYHRIESSAATPSKTSETETINVDESLFESELPSDIIRDLMEE